MPDIIITLAILWHLLARLAQEPGTPKTKRKAAPRLSTVPTVIHAKRARSNAERQADFRSRHGDRQRARHAAYMRQWRAQRKAAALAA